jgi:hypothetical protein
MGQWTACLGTFVDEAFSASFILLEKIRRSSSMSEKPAGGALRFEAWRIAGIFSIWGEDCIKSRAIQAQRFCSV